MDDLRLSYSPRSGATREGEIAALAAVYAFVLERHKQKLGAVESVDGRAAGGGRPEASPQHSPTGKGGSTFDHGA